MKNHLLVIIAGPTASGKTKVAIQTALYFNTEIISADSRQFYREMPIGTAAPSKEELSKVKHHFIGHLSVFDKYDVYHFEQDALKVLDSLFNKHQVVIAVGGSGLYLNVLTSGIDLLPDANETLRLDLKKRLEEEGLPSLRLLLKKLDPDYYQKVDLANPNRILRALEVCISSGLPYSSFRKNKSTERYFKTIKFCLNPERIILNEQINKRTDLMIKSGLIEEARYLFPHKHLNALNTVGYKELFDFFQKECSLENAITRIKTNTRRYAKRQITWFKKEEKMIMIRPEDTDKLASMIVQHIGE